MAKTRMQFSKERLENCELFIDAFLGNLRNISTIIQLYWKVKDYSKLKTGVFYHQSAISCNYRWSIQLVKAKGTLFVILSTNVLNKEVSFSILHTGGKELRVYKAEEIREGVYVSELCSTAIKNRNSYYLTNDNLTVQCEYEASRTDLSFLVLPYAEFRKRNPKAHILCYNLRKLDLISLWTDFTIKVKDVKFRIHKLVLRTRSQFFDGQLASKSNSKECVIYTHPFVMLNVIRYLYTAEFWDDSVICISEVFYVSHELKIDCLKSRCRDFLRGNITPHNAMHIYKIARRCHATELKNEALCIMPKEELKSELKREKSIRK